MKFKISKKKVLIALSTVLIIFVGLYFVFDKSEQNNQVVTEQTSEDLVEEFIETQPETEEVVQETTTEPEQPSTETENEITPSKWPVELSLSEASSLTVVVNKKYKLPRNYAPGLRSETSNALAQLISAASNVGIGLKTLSFYRSYDTQEATYSRWVARDGQALADTYSARPGHSEHQTGLAVDVGASNGVCDLETCFGNTTEGKWVAANAQNYGFIIRYPNGKDDITGYQYEPWHLRYVGVDVAIAVTASGQTLDQYYGVEGGGYN